MAPEPREVPPRGTEAVPLRQVPVQTDPSVVLLTIVGLFVIVVGVGVFMLRKEVERIDPNKRLP
jgi:hypothetical protein